MIRVDRIAIDLPAMSEEEAERLAVAVASALRGWRPAAPIRLERVTAAVAGPDAPAPGAALEPLAQRIAAAVVRAATAEAGA